ncbi:DUF2515 domain-containing protein [Bacillus sp. 31A1R]|uniref:DUF2515 domain-containing protein n=1 Tax=Robertmurraya mangrovi TaxID=3098077 RepID=A0ABU5J1E6_9BACI|nr:DUF2515 domain-containing protein [Bacillus sp. 31A1R]MDZ5473219.1 DUF2515 domain-containing protein [Bacillus sp. 31A1R]
MLINSLYSEKEIIQMIEKETFLYNKDNISRTNRYFSYYKQHKNIVWSFLASMVSRNAGYNMCDLEGAVFPKLLKPNFRERLFLTYERANWLIFQDAFPQLLLYHYSTKINRPMFHLLKYFHVSSFMEREWNFYWTHRDDLRLMYALIINEQNVIQKPVMQHPIYKKRVFHSMLFSLQDWFHFSAVLFPTCSGQLFGASVNGFRSVDKRIDLGKRLADILFNPKNYPSIFEFAEKTKHTGSRGDYEQYLEKRPTTTTPYLRATFPVVKHHISEYRDWSKENKTKQKWFSRKINHRHPIRITKWYEKKQLEIHLAASVNDCINLMLHNKKQG